MQTAASKSQSSQADSAVGCWRHRWRETTQTEGKHWPIRRYSLKPVCKVHIKWNTGFRGNNRAIELYFLIHAFSHLLSSPLGYNAIITLTVEAAYTFQISFCFNETMWRYILEGCQLSSFIHSSLLSFVCMVLCFCVLLRLYPHCCFIVSFLFTFHYFLLFLAYFPSKKSEA